MSYGVCETSVSNKIPILNLSLRAGGRENEQIKFGLEPKWIRMRVHKYICMRPRGVHVGHEWYVMAKRNCSNQNQDRMPRGGYA